MRRRRWGWGWGWGWDWGELIFSSVWVLFLVLWFLGMGAVIYQAVWGSHTSLAAPADVLVTAEGDVLVADPESHRVYRVEDNQLTVVAGSGDDGVPDGEAPGAEPAGDATEVDLGEPVALAERDGVVFVADRELGTVLRLDGGRVQALPGSWPSPHLVAATREGPVYAAVGPRGDERATEVVESAGPGGGAPLLVDLPSADADADGDADPGAIVGLGVSPDDDLVVWVEGDGLYVGDERIVAAVGDGERQPTDLAVGPDGDVAVLEPEAEEITVYRPDGGVRRRIELPWRPRAVALGADDEVVVVRESDADGTFVYAVEPDDTVVPLGPLPPDDDDDYAPSDPFPHEPPPTPAPFPPGGGFP